jgi:glycyl-tRNA synthetase beta chain
MPELLLELFSEEIPARMQAQAAKDLERLVVGALTDRGLLFEAVLAFAGPRRLTLGIAGLPAKQPDVSEEKKGPRVGAPEKAIEGFLKSAGVTLDQCKKESDAKGDFYVAVIARKGRATGEVLAELLPDAIAKLPWPKSMRWGSGMARWVRPLHGIVATFDGEVIPFEFAGVASGNTTWGHRFLSSGPITVRRMDDYVDRLRAAHVVVDAAERREAILHEAKQKSFALGLELVEDEGLLNEVTGLAEWPIVLVGTIDAAFMDLPPEILQTTMRTHQKYFSLRPSRAAWPPPQDDAGRRHAEVRAAGEPRSIASKFLLVANMTAEDGGREIVAGNERVLRARLSDAKFFWDQDRKRTLDSRVADLGGIVFHAKLGTQLERVDRIKALAREIAEKIGADDDKAERAALLCKADLTTGVVGEFPELQGIMGRYYALNDGEDADVANAIRDHYRPLGPKDDVPNAPISIAVALADKLDALVGLVAVGERATGSSDPFAIRRSAIAAINIILAARLRLPLGKILWDTFILVSSVWLANISNLETGSAASDLTRIFGDRAAELLKEAKFPLRDQAARQIVEMGKAVQGELLSFFADRLKVALREKGTRHDLIDAVFSLGNEDDLVRLVARVEALQAFLKTDDGANLLTGYKRAANILKIEEKKDQKEYGGAPDAKALKEDDEKALAKALAAAKEAAASALQKEDFAAAMSALAKLRAPVDRFFDKVTVNADDKALRENRLKLLSQIVDTAHQVADFSKIEG